jgi:hypothetical protein
VRPRPSVLLALAIVLVLGALAAGCGGDDDDDSAAAPTCPPIATELEPPPELPDGFPTPEQVTYTAWREAGPSTLVDGFFAGTLEEAFEAYKAAFDEAGYDIPNEEREQNDAEVNFEGRGTDGQVKLRRCADRTDVSITIRPL